MATYTSVADTNGDFTIPFSSNYTSGEKITVSAEKDSAVKTIELYAPIVTQSNPIEVGGSLADFPRNITSIKVTIDGVINGYCFSSNNFASNNIFNSAKELIIADGATDLGDYSFESWVLASSITLPISLLFIREGVFYNWSNLDSVTIPDSVKSIGISAFQGCSNLKNVIIGSSCNMIDNLAFPYLSLVEKITINATIPPLIKSGTFTNINSGVKFYVPAASLAAYKAAPIWKTFAGKIYAIA